MGNSGVTWDVVLHKLFFSTTVAAKAKGVNEIESVQRNDIIQADKIPKQISMQIKSVNKTDIIQADIILKIQADIQADKIST